MAEFGQPYRNATEDANNGVINPPTVRREATQANIPSQVKRDQPQLDTAFSSLGASLGGALERHLDEGRSNIVEQRKLDAARRQGTSDAINSIDASQKATGWKKFVFGEDASYREAQQRAAENGVTKAYLEQADSVWKHAGESSDDYYKNRLSPALDNLLKKYEGDPDTQRKVSTMWQIASKKLTESHLREHDAYSQLENRNTLKERIQLAGDVLTLEGSQVSTPKDAERILAQAKSIFNGDLIPSSMRPEAAQEVLVEQVTESLKAGNIGLYNAARSSGWTAKLNPAHLSLVNKAVDAYGQELKLEASAVVEQANIDASQATTVLDVEAIYDKLDDDIKALELRKPDTIKSKEGILQERSEAIANERTYIERIKSAKEKAVKEAAKAEAKAETAKANKERVRLEMVGDTTTGGIPLTKKEKQEAMDSIISENTKKLVGDETMTPKQIAGAILTDDKVNLAAVASWGSHEADSDIISQAITTFTNSDLSAFTDDKGRLNEEASNTLARLERFRTKDRRKFNDILGADRLAYTVLEKGIRSGHTQKRIEKDLELLRAGSKDLPPLQKIYDHDKGRNITVHEHVASTLQEELGGKQPTAQDIADLTTIFEIGLQSYNNDPRAAREYMLDDLRTGQKKIQIGSSTHFVRNVPGAKKLKNDISDVVNYAENNEYLMSKAVLLGKLSNDIDKKPITRLNEIPNLQVYTVAGYEGIFLDRPGAPQPVFLSIDQLKPIDDKIEQDRRFRDDELAARKEAQAKHTRELARKGVGTSLFWGMNVP